MQISCRFLLVFILAAILTKKEAWGKQHVVGGSQGWDESTDYDSWASSQTFKVGDELGMVMVSSFFFLKKREWQLNKL